MKKFLVASAIVIGISLGATEKASANCTYNEIVAVGESAEAAYYAEHPDLEGYAWEAGTAAILQELWDCGKYTTYYYVQAGLFVGGGMALFGRERWDLAISLMSFYW